MEIFDKKKTIKKMYTILVNKAICMTKSADKPKNSK